MHGHAAAYDTGAFLSRPVGLGFCASGFGRNLGGNLRIGVGMMHYIEMALSFAPP
jgi:hypothetical protein